MNLLLIAPLYDNKGAVRYFIGAQIDVNGLIENGRGLDSFERLLQQDRAESRYGGGHIPKTPHAALGELSNMLNEEDMDIVRHSGRESAARRTSGSSTPIADARIKTTGRRYVGMDDPTDRNLWPAPHLGPSGRLPGVFQNVSSIGSAVCTAWLTYIVPTRPPISVSPYNLHFSSSSHPRTITIPLS
jgi:hypothetical protein